MRKLCISSLFIGAFIVILSHIVSAEIRLGHFTLLPEITFQEMYRSNLYQTESTKVSDFVTTIAPGIGLGYTFGRNSAALDYKVGFFNFAHYSTNNYQDHRANGLLKFPFPGGFELALTDNFTKSTSEASAVIDRQRPYYQNLFSSTGSYKFADRWKVEVKYQKDDLRFDSSNDRSSQSSSDLVGMSLYYRLRPRLSTLIEYDYAIKDFAGSDISNYKEQLAYIGVDFDPKGKLRGSFKAGYGWKNFNNNMAGRDNSPHSWIMAGQLVQNFSSSTSLTLDAKRALLDDSVTENALYTDTMIGLGVQHFFTGKIGGLGSLSYRQADYQQLQTEPVTGVDKKRGDRTWTFGAGGIYNIQKWLQTKLEYQYITNDSNFYSYSYNDHRAIFKVVLSR
jgi:hypothetical protein